MTLEDESKVSTAMIRVKKAERMFYLIKKTVHFLMNIIPRDMEKSSPGWGRVVDYYKGNHGGRLNGFSYDSEIVGMVDASHYKVMDMVSSFIGAIANPFCELD